MYNVTRIEPGMTFGRLTVLEKDHRDKQRRKTYYRCRCECGGEAVVNGYNLKSGKTRSCGCLRSDSMSIVRGLHPKVEVSESTRRWILKHYCHTKNRDILDKYGLSEGWLHRFARANGLKKTGRFMKKCQQETTRKASFSHRLNNTYPPKGYRIPGSDECGFQKGVTPLERLGKRKNDARIQKSAESRKKTWKLEHARMTFGIPRETRLKVFRQPSKWCSRRWYLRKLGYVVDYLDAYWTPETSRSMKLEAEYKPFRFHPISERVNQNN